MKLKDIVVGSTQVKTPSGNVGTISGSEKILTKKKGRPTTLFHITFASAAISLEKWPAKVLSLSA